MADKDLLADARAQFQECEDAESDNRIAALDDLRFARLAEQWPEVVKKQREAEGRPCLTINRLPSFLRQVINEVRLNRPSIRVKPVGDGADPQTAQIMQGVIRNIEVSSQAEVAYDTAADFSASCGFGYFRIDVEYARDDSFETDLMIGRIANPFTVFGDPRSTAADSSDWKLCFVTERIPKEVFGEKYKGADVLEWQSDGRDEQGWVGENDVRVAEWWTREETTRPIVRLSDGRVLAADVYEENRALFDPAGITVVGTRDVRSHKVTQRIITGADILETVEWSGRYIPIVPVYGEELNVEGKRIFKSLIRDAKDAQRMLNYWRTAATELVALAPRSPWLVPEGAIAPTEKRKWETANTRSHPYLEYKGQVSPQRQSLDSGPAAGALQEAMNASDDLKSITGIYDASLGARSNETSGRAIMARQREGDVGTFHFIDNLSRAIRHAGRILVDLIPSVYNSDRVVRTMAEDGTSMMVPLGQPVVPQMRQGEPNPVGYQPVPQNVPVPPQARVFDLTAGKYDVVVESGPSFTTKREESSQAIIQLIQANPAIAPMVADVLAKNQDWPDADKIAERLRMTLPPHLRGEGPPPEVLQMQQQIQQMDQQMQQMAQENAALKADTQGKQMELRVKAQESQAAAQISAAELQVKREELVLKRQELALKAAEMQSEQAQLGEQHQATMQAMVAQLQQLQEAVQQIAQMAQQAQIVANTPRAKKGTAVKLADGRWALEAVEEVQPTIQ